MSVLRRALGIEQRSLVEELANAFPGDVQGTVGWQQGMVWKGYGDSVSTDQAMRLSAVFACLRLLSEAISTLPLDTFTRDAGTRRPFRPRPEYLSFNPPQSSRIDYLSQVILSLLTDGNAYVLVVRDRLGVPVDLIVLDPSLVTVERIRGKVTYRASGIEIPAANMMHIKGMTMPGSIVGLSPIGYARESIGLGLSAQRFGKSFLDNGAMPSAVIEVPASTTAGSRAEERDKARSIAQNWKDTHGSGSQGKVGVLLGGAKLSTISINPDDAQYLETRQFQVPDIARIFGVPPHLIADASNSTSWGSGLAEQNLAFGQFSLRPWIERIEDAHGRLLTTHGLPSVFIKLNLDALLRASLKDRYEAYEIGIRSKFLVPNEARSKEDEPPLPGGDKFPDLPGGAQ